MNKRRTDAALSTKETRSEISAAIVILPTVRCTNPEPTDHTRAIRRAARLLRDANTAALIDASRLRFAQWKCR